MESRAANAAVHADAASALLGANPSVQAANEAQARALTALALVFTELMAQGKL